MTEMNAKKLREIENHECIYSCICSKMNAELVDELKEALSVMRLAKQTLDHPPTVSFSEQSICNVKAWKTLFHYLKKFDSEE